MSIQVELDVPGIVLPLGHVLLPGIVLRMTSVAAMRLLATHGPLPQDVYKEVRHLLPFVGPDDVLVAIIPRDPTTRQPHKMATLARLVPPTTSEADNQPSDTGSLTVQGVARLLVDHFDSQDGLVSGKLIVDTATDSRYAAQLIDRLKAAVSALLLPGGETISIAVRRFVAFAEGISSPAVLIDVLASVLPLTYADKLTILDELDSTKRAQLLVDIVEKKAATLKAIASKTIKRGAASGALIGPQKRSLSENSRLGPRDGRGDDGNDDDLVKIEEALREAQLPAEGRTMVDRELKRLRRMSPQQADYNVTRTWLEVIADIPWNKNEVSLLSPAVVDEARLILDTDHYGLEKVKKRLLEYLAVLFLQQERTAKEERMKLKLPPNSDLSMAEVDVDNKVQQRPKVSPDESDSGDQAGKAKTTRAPILLLVGPPGVGKTSLAKSVARALKRKLFRISLGGIRDEAEIRGHRRTYIGAMPGVIIQGLRKAGSMNPVIVLDEIDKVGQGVHSVHGDPSAALLEVLDPEQNSTFVDHYVGFPVDLSNVIFIATANSLDTIPRPLLDRMEVIGIEGYTYLEKQHIAQNYLIPKQIEANALKPGQVKVPSDVINHIATRYTRESGVRSLERELGSLCRARAVEILDTHKDSDITQAEPITVQLDDLPRYLGLERYHDDVVNDKVDEYTDDGGAVKLRETYGVVNGLAYMGSGTGGLLVFEATLMPNGNGKLKLTGKLGDVISESAYIAMSWVRANAEQLGIPLDTLKTHDIHLHAPAGAIPKDGPSAGVAMTLCLVSLLAKRPVPKDLAMTGEITLRGKILRVGGIREKLLGAHMAGIKKVLLPYHTRSTVEDEYKFINEIQLEIVYVKYIWDVFAQVWPQAKQFKEPHVTAVL